MLGVSFSSDLWRHAAESLRCRIGLASIISVRVRAMGHCRHQRGAGGSPTLFYLYWIFPLRVTKQVVHISPVQTEASTEKPGKKLSEFRSQQRRQVHRTQLTFTVSSVHLASLVSRGLINSESHAAKILSEIVFPPMGYVVTFDSGAAGNRLLILLSSRTLPAMTGK